MPWREMSPMEQRLDFVRDWQTELFTMTELAAQYRISRKTGYKWLDRYEPTARGVACDRRAGRITVRRRRIPSWSRRWWPLRHRHPRWGAKKLLAVGGAAGGRRRVAESVDGVRLCSRRGAWSRRGGAATARSRRPARRWRRSGRVNEVVDDGFQRRVSNGRRRVLLSADVARRLQSLRPALRRVGRADLRRDASAVRARVCRVRVAGAHPQ